MFVLVLGECVIFRELFVLMSLGLTIIVLGGIIFFKILGQLIYVHMV